MLFDTLPAEGGRPFHQRFKPRTTSTDHRTRRREDTLWRHALRRPVIGRERWRGRRGLHCCCCNQLSHLDTKHCQKLEINTSIISQAIIPTPPSPKYLPTLRPRKCDFFFLDGNVGCNVHYGQGDTPTTSLVWEIWNITYMRLIKSNLRQKRDLNSVTTETSCLRIKMDSIKSLDWLDQRTRTESQTGNTGMGWK